MDKKATVCVGLTTEDYSLNKHIGREPKSFGYYSEEGRKWKNGESTMDLYGSPYSSGDVVGCGFNTVTREIFFTRNGVYLGVAFWDIPDIPLFASVSLRGVVGLTCVATFHGPFKFDLHALPDISPSMWSESLGDPTLSDEQVIYPPQSANASRLQQQQQQQTWKQEGSRGLFAWPANDVAIWLESIGYGQYRKEFYTNNISGRHLHTLSHQLLKNELGIESYGHRADILDRVNKLLATYKEKAGAEESTNSSIMDSTSDFTAGSGGTELFTGDYPPDHPNGASLNSLLDPHTGGDEVLQPFRPPLLHHPQAVHRFSDHENSEDEGPRQRGKTRPSNANSNQGGSSGTNLASLANGNDKDSRWRRRTVPSHDEGVCSICGGGRVKSVRGVV
jgi:SPRY domain/SAM domain (Sterile alpha motif)